MPAIVRTLRQTNARGFHDKFLFQRNRAPRNAAGGFGENWQTVCEVRGRMEPRTRPGSESMPADWTVSKNLYRVLVYWRADITEQMRILMGGAVGDVSIRQPAGYRVFQISAAPQTAREDRFMEIYCEEIKS